MLLSYRALLGRAGARPLVVACAVSWLSYSGYGLAVVLTVQKTTRSFALAGAAVAVQSLGAAALAPFRGRLVDRTGARARCAPSPPPTCCQPPCCSPAVLQEDLRCCSPAPPSSAPPLRPLSPPLALRGPMSLERSRHTR